MQMKAVGYQHSRPIAEPESLVDIDLPKPTPHGQDILVSVKAVSVNPVDAKFRLRAQPAEGAWGVLGWDVAGVVETVGPDVTLFKPGDAVWYAGSITRPGCNSEFHLVDERIVGRKPCTLSFAQAAALPLTSITAWEMLFDRLGVAIGKKPDAGAILIIGGAGGVGSIAVQLAKRLTGLTVIATASRPQTQAWVRDLGADHVVDHAGDMPAQMKAIGHPTVRHIFSTTQTDKHIATIQEMVAPQGKFGLIDDPSALDALPFKRKSVSIVWELMFTRSISGTSDLMEQHRLLNEIADLVDAGVIRTTLAESFGSINAANLKRAHSLIESNASVGKIVLEGFA
jgi:zinc-binding alcohol dehydrogenase family protein